MLLNSNLYNLSQCLHNNSAMQHACFTHLSQHKQQCIAKPGFRTANCDAVPGELCPVRHLSNPLTALSITLHKAMNEFLDPALRAACRDVKELQSYWSYSLTCFCCRSRSSRALFFSFCWSLACCSAASSASYALRFPSATLSLSASSSFSR